MASTERKNVSYSRRVHSQRTMQFSDVHKKRDELYIYDNTVRKTRVLENPEIERRRSNQRDINRQNRRNREEAERMNPGRAFVWIVSACVIFLVASYFLSLSAQVNANRDRVAELKTQIIDLKSDNNEYEKRLDMSIDIDTIKNTAINELGMVYPVKSQIVNYEYEESDYVRQYAQVPEE